MGMTMKYLRRAALACLLAGVAGASQAAICRVAPTASGAADGATWADVMTLPSALANTGCGEIWLQQGIYRTGPARTDFFSITRPVQLYGGFAGGETERGQRNSNSRLTVLSGDIGGDDTTPDSDGIVHTASGIVDGSTNNSYHVVYIDITSSGIVLTPSNTVIDGLTITGGYADTGPAEHEYGGGLYCRGYGWGQECSPRIANVTFSGNRATMWGGGMYVAAWYGGASRPEITRSTFSGNEAVGYGGGLTVDISHPGSISSPAISASTFSGNAALRGGGAFFDNFGGDLSVSLEHLAFIGNTASISGHALHTADAAFSIRASIFWGRPDSSKKMLYFDRTDNPGSLADSIVEGGCGEVSVADVGYTCADSPPGTGDPLLGALQDNGGPTWTRLPDAGGAAVNAATCNAGETDQRGVARPTGANACDIGAVERVDANPDLNSATLTGSTDQARQIALSWTAVPNVVRYEVRRQTPDTLVCVTSSTACLMTGLGNGTTVIFMLYGYSDNGQQIYLANGDGQTLAPPGQPASFSATSGEVRQATLTWTAPATGGAVAGYEVTNTATSAVVCSEPASSTGCVASGLADGTAYQFSLVARNAAGDGSARTADATTLALPGAPTAVAAMAGDGAVRLVWSAPAGGGAVTGYTVAMDGSPTSCSASPCDFTALANGTAYSFTVAAVNAAGSTSAAAVQATPATLGDPAVALPGGGTAAVVIGDNPPGCALSGPVTIDTTVPAGAPTGAAAPLGVLRFAAGGCAGATLAVQITYPAGRLAGLAPYKYGPPQAGEPPAWFAHGTITGDTVAYTVEDDGTGDNDTATAGVIEDPFILLALPVGGVAIPTLSQWGVLLLSALSALFGLAALRRRA